MSVGVGVHFDFVIIINRGSRSVKTDLAIF